MIERLKALGDRAEETLRIFESNLKIFEDHRDIVASAPRRFTVVGTAPAQLPEEDPTLKI